MTAPGRKTPNTELAWMPGGTVKANLDAAAAVPADVTLADLAAAMPGGGGTVTGADNVGSSGVGTYDSGTSTLHMRKVNAASTKLTVTLNGQQIDIDVAPANFTGIPESGVTGLVSDLSTLAAGIAASALATRAINTTAPLTGGGNLTADRTLALSIDASLGVSGGSLQRAALTGDATASAGSNTLTIASDAVTYAKMQNVSAASRVVGRGSAAGAGDPEELTLGASLVVNATSIERAALTGDVTASQNGNATTIASHAVTNAKAAQMAANTVKSNLTGSTADQADNAVAALFAFAGSAFFGDGSDGSGHITVNTTLTRDMFYTDLLIDASVVLTTGNFRIHCTGTLTNNGTIEMDGAAATSNTGASVRGTGGSFPVGSAGGTGSSSGAGGAGTAITSGVIGGTGGTGGTAGANAGGAGGAATAVTASLGGYRTFARLYHGTLLGVTGNTNASSVLLRPGTGGGGGASNAGGGVGGGGGSSGAFVVIAAGLVVNNGAIHANGGAGFAGATSGAGQGGGGSGGGGGVVAIGTWGYTGSAATASGGAGAAGANGGGAGTAGGAGLVVVTAP